MIDPKKPVRFRMPDMRPAKLVGSMPNGDLIIATTTSPGANATDWCSVPMIFDQNGRQRGSDCFMPVLVNEVKTTKMYLRVNGSLSHLKVETSAHSAPPSGDAVAAVELVMEDGIVVSASLYRANIRPFTNTPGL